MPPTTVVFDLGGVLVRWDPRLLYRTLLPTDDDVEAFLDEVGFTEWNHHQDAGRSWTTAVAELSARYPHRADLIAAYPARFPESVAGVDDDVVRLASRLHATGTRLLALTNWSAELFPLVRHRLGFLDDFDGVVVSGAEGLAKPDPRLFEVLIQRHQVAPAESVYVDDVLDNVRVAAGLGFRAYHFTDAAALRMAFSAEGLLTAP